MERYTGERIGMEIAEAEVHAAAPKKRAGKVTLYLDVDLREWLRDHCDETGIAQSRLMAIVIRRYKKEHSE